MLERNRPKGGILTEWSRMVGFWHWSWGQWLLSQLSFPHILVLCDIQGKKKPNDANFQDKKVFLFYLESCIFVISWITVLGSQVEKTWCCILEYYESQYKHDTVNFRCDHSSSVWSITGASKFIHYNRRVSFMWLWL